jgi:hypothetical protein
MNLFTMGLMPSGHGYCLAFLILISVFYLIQSSIIICPQEGCTKCASDPPYMNYTNYLTNIADQGNENNCITTCPINSKVEDAMRCNCDDSCKVCNYNVTQAAVLCSECENPEWTKIDNLGLCLPPKSDKYTFRADWVQNPYHIVPAPGLHIIRMRFYSTIDHQVDWATLGPLGYTIDYEITNVYNDVADPTKY